MLDDLMREISDIVEEDTQRQRPPGHQINISIGDNNTVIVGNGAHGHRGRDDGSDNESSSDPGDRTLESTLKEEVADLAYQVKSLKKLMLKFFLKGNELSFKGNISGSSGCLNSVVAKTTKRPDVAIPHAGDDTGINQPESRATLDSFPYSPVYSHLFPDVPYSMSPNTEIGSKP